MAEFPAAQPHGGFEEVFPDVFVVRGTFKSGPLLAITRNMTVVRTGGELTLLNSVRLSAAGLDELRKLGTPRHVVRVGDFHGLDDGWYQKELGLTLWSAATARARGTERPDRGLVAGTGGPIPGATVFAFERGKRPEFAVLIPREGGILVTCDSVQNWADFDGCSFLMKSMMKAMGFGARAQLGPIWKKELEGGEKGSLAKDFARLLELEWRHMLSGHGAPLRGTAKEDLRVQVKKEFGLSS